MTKTLAALLGSLPLPYELTGDPQTVISAPVVESDADLQPGGIFVARAGMSVDGHRFIDRALIRGAAAIVGEKSLDVPLPVPYVHVADALEAIGPLAAAWHDFPSRKLTVIGVTGTDGKTTTSTLIHRLLGEGVGLISTIAADLGGATVETGLHVTTPGAPQIQALLAAMVDHGLRACVLEMTSHGLAQGRLNGVDVDVAVMTNVTHEHLDYHGTFEGYRAAKARMFAMLTHSARKPGQPKIAVVNADDPSADFFAAIAADQVVRYGLEAGADLRAVEIDYQPGHTQFTLRAPDLNDGRLITLPLAGAFNVSNALAALAVGRALGVDWPTLEARLATVTAISGRMERIDEGQDFIAIVDFAHTPNALRNALETGRQMVGPGGRLIAVFGSAGLRDREKRRMMAETSAQLADVSVLTAEDPRTESLDAILEAMAQGCIAQGGIEGQTFIRVPDRGEALYRACQMARAGDVVMACGKGHEQSMCFGTIEYPWDDRDALRAALRGAPLKTLPTASASGNR
jgi:UDP-N-acetylmuramoyl-L-alanyl-D-glutamate--2,6-diaminopimelate ligase